MSGKIKYWEVVLICLAVCLAVVSLFGLIFASLFPKLPYAERELSKGHWECLEWEETSEFLYNYPTKEECLNAPLKERIEKKKICKKEAWVRGASE